MRGKIIPENEREETEENTEILEEPDEGIESRLENDPEVHERDFDGKVRIEIPSDRYDWSEVKEYTDELREDVDDYTGSPPVIARQGLDEQGEYHWVIAEREYL